MLLIMGLFYNTFGNPKAPVASGNWSNPGIWGGTTVPTSVDNVTIPSGQTIVIDTDITVLNITVTAGSTLNWTPGKRLTVNGSFTVNGIANLNGGLITLGSPGLAFNLGAGASFTWDPGINTSTEATLFTRGVENFSPTSTLIIKKWFSYTTALGSFITGNFGNLTLNSLSGASAIVEWDQNNQFETHQVLGTFTIDQGWITLDKSGAISNTILSSVVLNSVNSTLYGLNGNSTGSFQINTGSITNNGGTLVGLNDGTGNITLKVTGDFTNTGNVKLIMNSGVPGAGNGNATFNVSGIYSQSTGDTRFIYNVASAASGTFNSTIGNLNLTGGIFMGQTACHAGSGVCSLSVTNNLTVNFQNNADKFRGTSLSSIGANTNNTGFVLLVGGNLTYSGPASSEFTTSASYGTETIFVGGNLQVNGGVFSINYGTSAAAHSTNTQVNGNLIVAGGSTFFSRNAGYSGINIQGDALITNGMLTVKASTGAALMSIAGAYVQSGGTLYLHGNSALASADKIQLTILGNFTQSGGMFSFDDNSSNANATHELILQGSVYSLSGTGVITHAGPGTSQSFGLIKFAKIGTIQFQRSGSHQLQQVRQEVGASSLLSVTSGYIQVCSHPTAATDYFSIRANGKVQLKLGQFQSDAVFTNSGIQVDAGGVLEINRAEGMYNGSTTGSISSIGNMNYALDPNSIVEYAGSIDQTLTGTAYAITNAPQHKYGILRINLQNSSSAIINEGQVHSRTRLELVKGRIHLNGNSFVLENGSHDAVQRTAGYVLSEDDNSFFVWNNIGSGLHEFPFGISSSAYIPVLFTPLSGFGNSVSISTRATASSDNRPVPSGLLATVLSLVNIGFAENEVIDRWWKVSATGITANVTLKYDSPENTLSIANRLNPLGMRSWDGLSWTEGRGYGFGTLSGQGSVSISNVSQFSTWILATNNSVLPIELSLFQVKAFQNSVRVDWTTSTEINNEYFTIERSKEGTEFEKIGRVEGAGNSTELKIYSYVDEKPLMGRSYYRLKQTDYDGKFSYSEIKSVQFNGGLNSPPKIENVFPNPFDGQFKAIYTLTEQDPIRVILTHSSGKMIKSWTENGTKGENIIEFNEGSSLQPGTYILQIIQGEQMSSKKLIKK